MKLYYKRLLDLGFAGLRAYKNHQMFERTEAKARTDSASAERMGQINEPQMIYQPQIIGNSNFSSNQNQRRDQKQDNHDLISGNFGYQDDTCQFREDEETENYYKDG